jgi:hypothetical protein
MSEQLEQLIRNFPHYENRSLLNDEQNDEKQKPAMQLKSFVDEIYMRIRIEHEGYGYFNETELGERFTKETGIEYNKLKKRKKVFPYKQGFINLYAGWIEETGIAVIGLADEAYNVPRKLDR